MFHYLTCSWLFREAVHKPLLLFMSRFILRFFLCLRRFELLRLRSLFRSELCVLRLEVIVFLGELSSVLLQGHKLLRLGAPNGWNTTSRPQVVGRSVGPPDEPTSIHKSGSNSGWVKVSSPYLFLNRLLYVSWKKKVIIIFNTINIITYIITYKIKWLNKHTTKCWARLSTNCCAPF